MATARSNEAPGELALVRAFVNSRDIDHGIDAFASPADLRAWLAGRRLLAGKGAEVGAREVRRAVALREALRSLLLGNNLDAEVEPAAIAALNAVAGRARLALRVDDTGSARLEATAAGVDGALGRLLVIVYAAMQDGTWKRLKVCRNDTCRWAFYDSSKNRSGTWCTMAVCGSQMKARAYRRRRAETRPGPIR